MTPTRSTTVLLSPTAPAKVNTAGCRMTQGKPGDVSPNSPNRRRVVLYRAFTAPIFVFVSLVTRRFPPNYCISPAKDTILNRQRSPQGLLHHSHGLLRQPL